MNLRSKLLSLISSREYSKHELYIKLSKTYDENEINSLLDEFEQLGYISNKRYTEMYVNSRQLKYGKRRLVYELKNKGIDIEIINQQLELLGNENQTETAYGIAVKKFGEMVDFKLFGRIERFLLYRGFEMSVVRDVLRRFQK